MFYCFQHHPRTRPQPTEMYHIPKPIPDQTIPEITPPDTPNSLVKESPTSDQTLTETLDNQEQSENKNLEPPY